MPPKEMRRGGSRGGPARAVEPGQRNEYIPSFISKKPFYIGDDDKPASATDDYLEHQRLQSTAPTSLSSQKWYDRGLTTGPAATKWRKGACENCGAMTHKAKDCLSRPRKQGAKWTGRDIQADEVVQSVKLGWDAKRDRWNGYDANEYQQVVDDFNTLEEMKHKMKSASAGKTEATDATDFEEGEDDIEEGARYEEETDMGRQQSTSTRNLRIREDTAKYLLNLDLDSAKYDPKTRSMVNGGATSDNAAALVAEEGFLKASGDAAEFESAERYAWESQQKGGRNQVHLQANPTSGEVSRRKEKEQSAAKRVATQKALLEKYGSQAGFQQDASKGVVESQRFTEYDEKGKIKGAAPIKVKSSYAEDVFTQNHTSVWGSWWSDFKWGYACCHSTIKNSYCTGSVGKLALQEADRLAESQEVSREEAWKEDERLEEHVPNAAHPDLKVSTHEKKRKVIDDAGDAEGEPRKKRVVAEVSSVD